MRLHRAEDKKQRLNALSPYCYEGARQFNAALKGKLVVHFVLTHSGALTNVGVDEDTMGSSEVSNCIVRSIGAWMSPFHPAEPVPVAYPITFSPPG